MAQDKQTHFPSGLPARFANGKEGFKRLCDFLRIQNRKQRQALRAAVKPRVQHKNVSGLSDADRQRELITAFYETPDERCTVWRFTVAPSREVSDALGLPIPSLEERALERYDTEYRERALDRARLEDALGEFPDGAESFADAPEWRRPALAVWPDLHRDVTGWIELSADRRDAATLALFAVATILDDVRLLRWAADRVGALAEEFAPVLKSRGGDHEAQERIQDDGVVQQWRETCKAIAETARRLGADPPEPQHLEDLRVQVDTLDGLRESVVAVRERDVSDDLLQKFAERVAVLCAEYEASPIAECADQAGAQWRLAYPDDDKLDLEALRDDVERAGSELQEGLENWQRARDTKADLDRELEAVKRRQSSASSLADRFDAENREGELQDQIAAAHKEIRAARDHIFAVVAPAGEQFKPAEDYTARLNDGASGGPVEQPDSVSDEEDAGYSDAVDDTSLQTDEAADGGGKANRDSGETTSVSSEVKKNEDLVAAKGMNDADSDGVSKGDDGAIRSPTGTLESEAADEDTPASDEVDGAPGDSATMALWRMLGEGRPGIAYHIAKVLSEQGGSGTLTAYPDIIAAAMLAPHVQSADSKVVAEIRRIMEQIDPNELLRSDWDDDARDAVSLLLVSATLRPALLASTTGAPSLLRRVGMSEGLTPVYQFATVVADHADRLQGVRLDASLLQAKVGGRWQEEFDSFAARVRDWSERAKSKRNLFGRADRVWRDLLRGAGLLGELVTLLSDAHGAGQDRVEEIRKQIGDRKAFNDLVHKYDQKSLKGDAIQGRALKQVWNDVQPVRDMSSEWLRLMATRPSAEDFVGQRIDALQGDLDKHGGDAIAALDGAGCGMGIRAAAARYARLAVTDMLRLFDDASRVEKRELEPKVILSRDLLFVTGLDLDGDFQPTPADDTELFDRLVDTDAHVDSARKAFNARLERQDLIGARLAWDLVDAETEGVPDADECRELLIKAIEDHRKERRAEIVSTQEDLERAFCHGQIDTDERNDIGAALTSLREVATSASSRLPSPGDVAALAGAFARLEALDRKIKESCANSIRRARERLLIVPDDKTDDNVRLKVEQTIEQGYILTAYAQIDRLEKGETIAPPPLMDDPFQDFMKHVGEIENERKATNTAAIVRAAERRERAAGVSFEALADETAGQAADLLESWYRLAQTTTKPIDPKLLRELLQHLGFKVLHVTRQAGRGWPAADVKTEAIEDRTLCPSRQFGSEAAGRYRVLLNWDRPADESILRSIGTAGNVPTFVLHFGCLGPAREKLRAQAVQAHRLFLVVDESLILFLASRSGQPLSALFRCALPFSSAEPYATTSGLVPPELFYGRERERQRIMDQSGASFIYGGRQLGKTALLRRVERDFNRLRDAHAAKWIDLKASEIGYARAAHDIWRLLQLELERSGVLAMRRELDPENEKQVRRLLGRIRQWLDEHTDRRLLLLLDEADQFLVQDAKTDFRESTRLKGLMDDTGRRFKVVFAGLHNVLRTTRQANHPLAHLGDPICVGAMLSNGEWEQAHELVREPLQAVGCRFERDGLSTRILAQTNYYPSLIQLYGAEIAHRLRNSKKPFPYAIGDNDIDGAYASKEFSSAIRNRFLLTLGLDQRYEVIAFALAYELTGESDLGRGLEHAEIMRSAKYWWPEGFDLQDVQFDMLLHEMEGLGVLRAVQPGRYTLRNPNILFLLGSREEIENTLTEERTLPMPFDPASFRARYPNDPPSSARRGPLTYQQETDLRSGGVAVISGCSAAGLADVEGFISKRIGPESFHMLEPSANVDEFEKRLREISPDRNSVTMYIVSSRSNWDLSWLSAAKRILRRKARGRKLWSRVAFIATSQDLWRLLTEGEESVLDGIDWIGSGPCDETFLRRWLEDTNLTADADNASDLFKVSGGWMKEIESFSKKRPGRSWETRIDDLRQETLRDPARRLQEQFGLSEEAETVFRGLARADDPFDHDSIQLVAGDVGYSQEELRLRVVWGERLGLLSRARQNGWTFNPLVRRLIEASTPVS